MDFFITKDDKNFKVRIATCLVAFLLLIFITREIIKSEHLSALKNNNEIIFPEGSPEVTLSLYAPTKLSGLTLDQISSLRKDALKEVSQFLKVPYERSESVFGRIKDGAAWYGREAYYKDGPSGKAGEGSSVASVGILNPFILLVPEFWGITHWGNGNVKWKENVSAPDGVFSPAPKVLTVNSEAKEIRVVYDLTSYLSELNLYTRAPVVASQVDFGVSAYNARDLGVRYMKFTQKDSVKVRTDKGEAAEYINEHFRFTKTLCGVGCNHFTSQNPRFDTFVVEGLPATAVYYLWKNRTESESPDIKFIIELL